MLYWYPPFPFAVECDPATTCNGAGVCADDGSCTCNTNFDGAACDGRFIILVTLGYVFFSRDWLVFFPKLIWGEIQAVKFERIKSKAV